MSDYTTTMNRFHHYLASKPMNGVSPVGLYLAFLDWAAHISMEPGTQAKLASKLVGDILTYKVDPKDKRFSAPEWQRFPFNFLARNYSICESWWDEATRGVRGVTRRHEEPVNFTAKLAVGAFNPANYFLTNPVAQKCTKEENGANLVRGWFNFLEDAKRNVQGEAPAGIDTYKVGENIAVTPGKVVARTDLMELIQYSPTTETVHPDPILIVPAWIMKYYILDLSPKNSFIKYMVDQGFTVFSISWKNPDEKYRDYGMEKYRLAVMDAIDAVEMIVPDGRINALGYCLGGTMLSIVAATMAREYDERLKSVTLLAAQTDFSEPGELNLFLGDSTLAYLEDAMHEKGYLDGKQMAATFVLLRSNDLFWQKNVHDYLLGERSAIFDMMAWNADTTRMPARMHSEYLRQIFFENKLSQGRYLVEGKPIALRNISVPMFVVGTETDHVAPWKSVYQVNVYAHTDVTFLLTSGGHNAGIVSEPGRKNRRYRVSTALFGEPYVDAETWKEQNEPVEGSWWEAWANWLIVDVGQWEGAVMTTPPQMGAAISGYPVLCDAPGLYVHE